MVGVAAPKGITLGVLPPLQDKLLPLVGGVLIAHPAGTKAGTEELGKRGRGQTRPEHYRVRMDSRAALHPQGAHRLKAELHHVAALGGELVVAALEALLIVDDDLWRQRGESGAEGRPGSGLAAARDTHLPVARELGAVVSHVVCEERRAALRRYSR